MSVLKYFKNTLRSPLHRATGLKCNFFFFKFATRFLAKKNKGACRPTNGRQGPVAHPRGDRALAPTRGATASQRCAHACRWSDERMQVVRSRMQVKV